LEAVLERRRRGKREGTMGNSGVLMGEAVRLWGERENEWGIGAVAEKKGAVRGK
jgi:hypothetical protein